MKSWVRHATERVKNLDTPPSLNYKIDINKLSSTLAAAYIELDCDEETKSFLSKCYHVGYMSTIAANFLNHFKSVTDTNGILGRGKMFVVSQAQVLRLIQKEVKGTLLDVGAGDGNVTLQLAPLVSEVLTTEVSGPMVKALKEKGFNCIQTQELSEEILGRKKFEVISCLNVIDRTDTPETLLKQISSLLEPDNGILILAVVLPFSAFVEKGTKKLPPKEILPMKGGLCSDRSSFENSLQILYDRVLVPLGYKIVALSRVPYLSQGDMSSPFFVLDDAILVLKHSTKQKQETTEI